MPVRKMTDDERDRIFGNGLIIFGQVRPPIVKSQEARDDERKKGELLTKNQNHEASLEQSE